MFHTNSFVFAQIDELRSSINHVGQAVCENDLHKFVKMCTKGKSDEIDFEAFLIVCLYYHAFCCIRSSCGTCYLRLLSFDPYFVFVTLSLLV